VALALVAAIGFVLAGVGFLAHQSWWGAFGIGAGVVALALMALYFNPWLLAGIAISGASCTPECRRYSRPRTPGSKK
jgi:hypothetical protein